MKILQINKLYYPVIGGIETTVQNIAEKINHSNDLEIDVLACQTKGKRSVEIINDIKVYKAASFGKKMGMPISFDFFCLFFKLHNKYDKIILHFPFPLAAMLTPFIRKQKILIYYHSDIVRQKIGAFIFSPFIKYSLKRADKILVGSENLIKYSPLLNKYKNKCITIPFGIDITYTDNDKERANILKSQYQNRPLLLAVGRLVYYKGFEYAIEAMKSIDAHLLIIGTGPDEEKLKNLIKEFNLEDKINILPPQPILAPYFLACDLFLFPSVEPSEAFGLVQLEAMAAGKPVINTYLHTGVEEVSLNGETGVTIAPRNYAALSEAINLLLNNPELKKNYGDQALKRYQQQYTLETFNQRLINILK